MRGYYKILFMVFYFTVVYYDCLLFPRFFNDIRFRMMGAKFFLVVFIS